MRSFAPFAKLITTRRNNKFCQAGNLIASLCKDGYFPQRIFHDFFLFESIYIYPDRAIFSTKK